jgi:hypothetical protein
LERIRDNFYSSIRDNWKNIRAAKREHRFRSMELQNGESCCIEMAIERIAAEIIACAWAMDLGHVDHELGSRRTELDN